MHPTFYPLSLLLLIEIVRATHGLQSPPPTLLEAAKTLGPTRIEKVPSVDASSSVSYSQNSISEETLEAECVKLVFIAGIRMQVS